VSDRLACSFLRSFWRKGASENAFADKFAEGGGNGGSRAFSVGNVEQGTELSGVKTRRNDDAFVFAGFHNAVKTMHTGAGG